MQAYPYHHVRTTTRIAYEYRNIRNEAYVRVKHHRSTPTAAQRHTIEETQSPNLRSLHFQP